MSFLQRRKTALTEENVELTDSSSRPKDTDPPILDKDLKTRNWCIAGLVFAGTLGLVSLLAGILLPKSDNNAPALHWGVNVNISVRLATVIPLLLNALVTIAMESIGYIHNISLKWSLLKQERLTFNANLRLFTSTGWRGPNSCQVNTVVLLCTSLAYAACSTFFPLIESEPFGEDVRTYVVVSAPLIFLGTSLIITTIVSFWALMYSSANVITWSSNPLVSVCLAKEKGLLNRVNGQCMSSVHETLAGAITSPARPKKVQASGWKAHREVRMIVFFLWLACASFVAVGMAIAFTNSSLSGDGELCPPQWAFFTSSGLTCARPTVAVRVGSSQGGSPTSALGVVVLMLLQSPVTVSLHCAELIVNLSRDEQYWRCAATKPGCKIADYSSVRAAFTSWQTVILLLSKLIVHWMFGRAVDVAGGDLAIWSAQLVYTGVVMAVVAMIVTYMALRRPSGPQPAAFGHLQTLANLVDEWPESGRLHWGHKSDADADAEIPAHAGTSEERLPRVDMDSLYAGSLPCMWNNPVK